MGGGGGEGKVDSSESSSSSSSDEDYEERVIRRKGKSEWERRIQHYCSTHRILLVGDGDFSFSLSLARAFGSGTNMVATSLDSQEALARKFGDGIGNVRKLEELGCLVLHGIDATKMSDHFFLRTQRFDRIVYNFPHVGFKYQEGSNRQIENSTFQGSGRADRQPSLIAMVQCAVENMPKDPKSDHGMCKVYNYLGASNRLNKELVKGFLKNAKTLLKKNGEIHVSHKIGAPYDQWNLKKKAEKNGLMLKEVAAFHKNDYPGYCNKRADGNSPDDAFALGECATYKFGIKAHD